MPAPTSVIVIISGVMLLLSIAIVISYFLKLHKGYLVNLVTLSLLTIQFCIGLLYGLVKMGNTAMMWGTLLIGAVLGACFILTLVFFVKRKNELLTIL